MSPAEQQLEAAVAALEGQRAALGDLAVDAMLAGLRAKLAALSVPSTAEVEPVQTLKQVTILFLDIVGSTTLAQHLDPEAICEVMDDALSRGTAIVEAHRGKVLQYAGDSILAVFGADEAREDDAERAVQCGLALLNLGRVLSAEVQADRGHAGFDVRIGLHTGGVLLGGRVDAEGSIRGIPVNIAARMEQTAPAGTLRISQDTYALVRGLFEVRTQEPLSVKGLDTRIQSYLVLRAKPRSFRIGTRGIEGVATRMIGREVELDALQAAYHRLFKQRKFAAVTVVAEAGIGKSRLLHEFEDWSQARPESFFLFHGRATPATGTQVFGLLRDVIAWRFQIHDDDSVEDARSKMEAGIVPLFLHDDGPDLAEGHAHLLGHLIGIECKGSRHLRGILDDPKQIRNRAFHTAAQLFRRISAGDGAPIVGAAGATPIILLLEDLHWADGESLDFLAYLTEVNRDVPMMVLSFTRPTLFELRTDWINTEGIHQRIDLLPLSQQFSLDLAAELLKNLPDIPTSLRELLTRSADGNPFYMEELVKMLIDQGSILTHSGSGEAWQVNAERLLVTNVPPTLTGVLQARLDGLPAPEKRALQKASVVGAVFWDQALAAVESQAAEQLPALVKRKLTLPRPPTTDAQLNGMDSGIREYAFHHQVLHQVVYDTVLKRHKLEGHARVARWLAHLAEQGSLRGGDLLGLAAEHFERAGHDCDAAEFHARAAEQAGERLAHDRVLTHVGRALVLLGGPARAHDPAQAELRWRLLWVRENTLQLQARRDEQAVGLEALGAVAELLADDRRRAEVAWRRAIRAMRMDDWSALEKAARHGMACASRAGDDAMRLRALGLLALALEFQGDIAAGEALAQQGLAEARRLGLRAVEARLLNALEIAADRQGNLVGAINLARQSIQIHRETGDRVNEAIGLTNLGGGWASLGDLAQAQQYLDASLHLLRANGDWVVEGAALANLSTLALWQGDETRALALARQALEIAVASQAREHELRNLIRQGEAELALGRRAAARQSYTQALALAREIDNPNQYDASAGLARVALADKDNAEALKALWPILDHIATGGTLDRAGACILIELTCHQVLALAGGPGADEWLVRAHSALIARAEAISDPELRQGFLHNIPYHREIVAVWAKRASLLSDSRPGG